MSTWLMILTFLLNSQGHEKALHAQGIVKNTDLADILLFLDTFVQIILFSGLSESPPFFLSFTLS